MLLPSKPVALRSVRFDRKDQSCLLPIVRSRMLNFHLQLRGCREVELVKVGVSLRHELDAAEPLADWLHEFGDDLSDR